MRIAVFHDLPSGGAKRALHELCRGLAARGHVLGLFVPETASELFLPLDGIVASKQVFEVRGARRTADGGPAAWTARAWFDVARCHRGIAAAIDRGGYDVAFVHQGRYPSVPAVLRFLAVPSVLYCQEPNRVLFEAPFEDDTPPTSLKDRLRRIGPLRDGVLAVLHRKGAERRNARSATVVLANSRHSQACIRAAYGVESVVRYLGVDAGRFRPAGLPRERMVLAVGAVHPAKGHRFLVTSVACIEASKRPSVVIIADREKPGERDHLQRMAAESGVELAIRRVDDDELIRTYNQASVVAAVPYLEPFGLTPIEAMACGTPVVGIREGGIPETVRDGETGFLVDRDPHACAAALRRVLEDPDLRSRMGAAGRRCVESEWTWEQSTERVEQTLLAACPSDPTASSRTVDGQPPR